MIPNGVRFRVARRCVPELSLARDYDEQLGVYNHSRPGRIFIFLGMALFFGLLAFLSLVEAFRRSSWSVLTLLIPLMPLIYIALIPSTVRECRRRARRYLQLRGVPICTKCGYSLQGVEYDPGKAPNCPECGDSIDRNSDAGIAQLALKQSSRTYRMARRLVPELGLARTDFERGYVLHATESSRLFQLLYGFIVVVVVIIAQFSVFAVTGVIKSIGINRWMVLFVAVALGALGLAIIRTRRSARKAARRALGERGLPFCRHCGYDLRGADASATNRCPECGEPVSEKALPLLSEAAS